MKKAIQEASVYICWTPDPNGEADQFWGGSFGSHLACHTESLERAFRAKGRLLNAIPGANLQINVHFEAEVPDRNNI